MMESAVTWHELAAIGAIMSVVVTAAWYVFVAIKRQFETQAARVDAQFERMANQAEDRARRTHERIEGLGKEVRETFVLRDLFQAEIRRLDQANDERDRQLVELNHRLHCPSATNLPT